jgi:CheY-like chemotaxis protein
MATILIVDDDRSARNLLVDLLEFEGHVVVACDNGADGLKAAERQNPDLVISDSRMPAMTGKQFIAALRRQTRLQRTPFIFHTAAGDEHEFQEIVEAYGVAAILTKPCSASAILAAITSALNVAPRESVPAIPESLRRRIPAYIASCEEEVAGIELALASGELASIQEVGHKLKGTGSAYGFPLITRLGRDLEDAAKAGDRIEIAERLAELGSYLEAIKVSSAGLAESAPACAQYVIRKSN